MLKEIPKVIYDKEGMPIRVVKYSKVFFKDRNEEGYVFHVERAERVTSVSEFELREICGNYFVEREIFKDNSNI